MLIKSPAAHNLRKYSQIQWGRHFSRSRRQWFALKLQSEERTGSQVGITNPSAHPLHERQTLHLCPSHPLPPASLHLWKVPWHFKIELSVCGWGASTQTHEPIGNVSHSNHGTGNVMEFCCPHFTLALVTVFHLVLLVQQSNNPWIFSEGGNLSRGHSSS